MGVARPTPTGRANIPPAIGRVEMATTGIWSQLPRDSASFGATAALRRYTENDEPHPQVDFAFGFLIVNPPPVTLSTKSTSAALR